MRRLGQSDGVENVLGWGRPDQRARARAGLRVASYGSLRLPLSSLSSLPSQQHSLGVMDWPTIFCIAGAAIAVLILLGLVALRLASPVPRRPTASEHTYRDGLDKTNPKPKQLPSLLDDSLKDKVTLSIIVPSYNETARLPGMLEETVRFCRGYKRKHKGFTFEIIVVDDGSRDKTSECALDYAAEADVPEIRVLTFEKNRGKGGAVTQVGPFFLLPYLFIQPSFPKLPVKMSFSHRLSGHVTRARRLSLVCRRRRRHQNRRPCRALGPDQGNQS